MRQICHAICAMELAPFSRDLVPMRGRMRRADRNIQAATDCGGQREGHNGLYAVLACPQATYWRLPVASNMSTQFRCHCAASFIHTSTGFAAAAGLAAVP